jgi:hypothetical protein
LALYRYLADVRYPAKGSALGDLLFLPADGQRFALGIEQRRKIRITVAETPAGPLLVTVTEDALP